MFALNNKKGAFGLCCIALAIENENRACITFEPFPILSCFAFVSRQNMPFITRQENQ